MKLIFILLLVLVVLGNKDKGKKDKCNKKDHKNKGFRIQVAGDSTVYLEPTIGVVTFAILINNADSKKALQEANNLADKAVTQIKAILADDPKARISTGVFQLSLQYDYSQNPIRFIGYQITNQLIVSTTKLLKIGQIISTGVEAGLNTVDGIEYTNTDSEKKVAKQEATKLAIQDAIRSGKLIAKELGQEVKKIVGFQQQDQMYYGGGAVPASAGARNEKSTPVYASQQQQKIRVDVELLLKPSKK